MAKQNRSTKTLELKNPHSAYAAIKARPQDVIEVVIKGNRPEGMWDKVLQLAQTTGVAVRSGIANIELKQSRQRSSKHQNKEKTERAGHAWAVVKAKANEPLDQLFHQADNNDNNDENQKPGLWLALDCLQDPHNVGAIFRTAGFFGVNGVIVTQDRSAPINGTVYDVASGGMESTPFSVETNLSRTLTKAKDAGLWILGASEHATEPLNTIEHDRPWLLVIGNEEKGIRRLTRDRCDTLCSIPAKGTVNSLNASAAAAVLIAHFLG